MLAILHINIKNSFRMKKKILSGVALALLITAGYGVNKNMNGNENLSNLALSNVEALAFMENPDSGSGQDKYYKYTFGCIDLETGKPTGKTGVNCTRGGYSDCVSVPC